LEPRRLRHARTMPVAARGPAATSARAIAAPAACAHDELRGEDRQGGDVAAGEALEQVAGAAAPEPSLVEADGAEGRARGGPRGGCRRPRRAPRPRGCAAHARARPWRRSSPPGRWPRRRRRARRATWARIRCIATKPPSQESPPAATASSSSDDSGLVQGGAEPLEPGPEVRVVEVLGDEGEPRPSARQQVLGGLATGAEVVDDHRRQALERVVDQHDGEGGAAEPFEDLGAMPHPTTSRPSTRPSLASASRSPPRLRLLSRRCLSAPSSTSSMPPMTSA
jgi:hypothetical protein